MVVGEHFTTRLPPFLPHKFLKPKMHQAPQTTRPPLLLVEQVRSSSPETQTRQTQPGHELSASSSSSDEEDDPGSTTSSEGARTGA
jgi:hypothetical protein